MALKVRRMTVRTIDQGGADALSNAEVLDLAFDHLGQMASLLQASGHREIAALMQGVWDMHELAQRPNRQPLTAEADDTLAYVLGQLTDLAVLLDQYGCRDAALLFRMPGEVHKVRQGARCEGAEF
jgi:hypothetical protein